MKNLISLIVFGLLISLFGTVLLMSGLRSEDTVSILLGGAIIAAGYTTSIIATIAAGVRLGNDTKY